MKTILSTLAFSILFSTGLFAQGPLAPTSAPTPTMKTLDQIEPAHPLVAGQPGVAIGATGSITISAAGSYYLTDNLTVTSGDGIVIGTSNVSLDLRGFTISSSGTGGLGINITGVSRINIRNGSIRGSATISGNTVTPGGFASGISFSVTPGAVHVSDLLVEQVGTSGIDLGNGEASVVESCIVRTIGNFGIRAGIVTDSVALNTLGSPITCVTANNCVGKKNTGITLIEQSTPAGDARTAILTAPYFISQPGSYYLATNLTVTSGDAITITADNVTLDLNGFAIRSTTVNPAAGSGVNINGTRTNVTVRNGSIQGGTTYNSTTFSTAGFYNGIFTTATDARNLHIEDISVSNVRRGIFSELTAASCLVQSCQVHICETAGIKAGIVRDSTATVCGGIAVAATNIFNCTGQSISDSGIFGEQVENCKGTTDSSNINTQGIYGANVSNSSGTSYSAGYGIYGQSVQNSLGTANTGAGIYSFSVTGSRGSSSTGIGLRVIGTAANCFATNTGFGTAPTLQAQIAIGCVTTGGAPNVTNKYNMP